jgi:chloramphenicol 3-O phosphotransferase
MTLRPGNVIFLNGTSSAGNTAIATALQEIMDGYYIHTGIDHFLERLPEKFFVTFKGNNPPPVDGVVWIFPDGDDRLSEIRLGPVGYKVRSGVYHAIAGLVRSGNDVIVDDVIFDPVVLKSAVDALYKLNVLFVGVQCPLEIAEQREHARGDRTQGLVRAHYDLVHAHGTYDFEVDTSRLSAVECALKIKDRLLNGSSPVAFKNLRAGLRTT